MRAACAAPGSVAARSGGSLRPRPVEFYAPAAELKNDPAHRCTREAPLRVSGDPVLLAQALSNLIDNALKYAPENGLIDVTLRRCADSLAEIAVTDDGPGILDSEKAKVVERFYRGDASRGTPGVGLGLSLVHAVAKLHGSSMGVCRSKSRTAGGAGDTVHRVAAGPGRGTHRRPGSLARR